MADTKTASQWQAVAAQLAAQAEELIKNRNSVNNTIAELQQAVNFSQSQLNDPNLSPADRASLLELIQQNNSRISQLQVTVGQYNSAIAAKLAEEEAARGQYDTAEDAPYGTRVNPTTSSNPEPANPEPGNNTAVAPIGDTAFELANIEPATQPAITREQEAFLQANLSEPESIPVEPTREQAAFLEANLSEPETIPADTAREREAFLEANLSEPATIDPDTEFGDLEGAIARNREDDAARAEVDNLAGRYPPTSVGVNSAQTSGNLGRLEPFPEVRDYRVRISLAKSANYLYMEENIDKSHLLYPLKETNGVIFPYTPTINISYSATYASTDLTHSNYKIQNYVNSAVDSVSIVGIFTAQDVVEANYVLATIHFFRTVTKMFYGQSQNRGVPPPLVYLTGHGEYGFDNHAMVITNFTLNYPEDCDYINAGPTYNVSANFNPYTPPSGSNPSTNRLYGAKLQPGGVRPPPSFGVQSNRRDNITRVPTKLQLTVQATPIVSRYNISNKFSLQQYASGQLLKGSQNPAGGFW